MELGRTAAEGSLPSFRSLNDSAACRLDVANEAPVGVQLLWYDYKGALAPLKPPRSCGTTIHPDICAPGPVKVWLSAKVGLALSAGPAGSGKRISWPI